jgi:tetratricopeptide (TPR) repeat protein
MNANLAEILLWAHRPDEAMAQFHKTLEIDQTFFYAHEVLGQALQLTGDLSAAITEYTRAQQLSDSEEVRVMLATAKAQSGDKEAAVQMLAEMEEQSRHRYVHPYWRALLYLSLGNHDEAIRWLAQTISNAGELGGYS